MKKTYINPTMKVVKITTQKMLAESASPRSFSGSSATVDGNNDYTDARGGIFDEGEE